MRIGIAQTSPEFGERDRNLREALDLIGRERADLCILPELFASGYQFIDADEVRSLAELVPDGPTTQALVKYARQHDCHIVAGLPERDGERLFNSAVLVGPDTANRVGEESRTLETLVYTGQSQVVGPDGEILVRLSKDKVEIAVVEIDIEKARNKRITDQNDVLADRRPDQYRL